MNKYYLGIDTSAYTTSIAVVDEQNNIVIDLRKRLVVDKNQRGLRQQEAIFQHLNNFPLLIKSLSEKIDLKKIDTISTSVKPRNIMNSYMPVFIFGKNQALILSEVLKTKYKEFSHQEGHIAAGLLSNPEFLNKKFMSLHISGGTSEVLMVEDTINNLKIKLIGGTLDLSFGQLIDRIGVLLGYQFPSGKKLDEISQKGNVLKLNIALNVKDSFWTSISGLENYFQNLISSGKESVEDIILTLFHTIAIFLESLILNINNEYGLEWILITGGVAANTYIRKYLSENLIKKNIYVCFSEINLSTDNAIGVSYLGKNKIGHFMEV